MANTYFEVDKTSSFSFSHFCSSSSSVVWEILLVSSLVIIWSRLFLCGRENTFEYMYYIIEFCNSVNMTLSRITLYNITHKYVSASSLISSLFPSSPSSLKAMISSQSFSFVTISSIRSAPQLSQLAPVGQFSLKSEMNDTYSYSEMRRL